MRRYMTMNNFLLLMIHFLFVFSGSNLICADFNPLKFTILYDNYVFQEGTKADWGFSCLIEGPEKTILFDTGTRENILMHNSGHLGVDLGLIDCIVISHDHGDHTGGLSAVLEKNPDIDVYMPASFADKYRQKVDESKTRIIAVSSPLEICPGVILTGEMGDLVKEQSLVLDSRKGLVIVSGCSHQGVVEILKKAKEVRDKDIYLMFGGFHLMQHSDSQVAEIISSFREMAVKKCGATHCTGDHQIGLFKKAFGEDYIPMGTGQTFVIGN